MGSKHGFKALHTAVGPSIRLAFDVNFDKKFNQLLSPGLHSKHVVGKTANCENGVCGAEGLSAKMETKVEQEL